MSGNVIILSTVIQTPLDLQHVSQVMDTFPDISDWSVDLEDCDQIMRVVCTTDIGPELLINLAAAGVSSRVLEVFDAHGISKIPSAADKFFY